MVPFAFSDNNAYVQPSLSIEYPSTENTIRTNNTPQFDDTLTAAVNPKSISDSDIKWFRFYNNKYDENGNLVQASHYIQIATGKTYKVVEEDIDHVLKCTVDTYSLSAETEPVTKIIYDKVVLTVKNNTYYGDTDGSIYYLDQRMEYSHDGVTVHSVESEGSSLFSGENLDSLNPNGYTWMVRYKETSTVKQQQWTVYTIAQGQKIDLTKIDIENEVTLTPSDSQVQLSYNTYPDHAYVDSIKWTSSDESVAVVNSAGKVTAKGNGSAVITCTVNEGSKNGSVEKSAQCNVTVNDFDKLQYVELTEDSISMSIEDSDLTRVLAHTVYPEDISGYTETWTSSNENVAIVSDGILAVVGTGKSTITYTVSKDGISKSDCLTLIVAAPPSVECDSSWGLYSGQDFVITFTSFPIDSRLVVTIDRPDHDSQVIPCGNYEISGNKLTISHEYLALLGLGSYTLHFEMPDDSNSSVSVQGASYSSPSGNGSIIRLLGESEPLVITKCSEDVSTLSVSFTISKYSLSPEKLTLTPDSYTKVSASTIPNGQKPEIQILDPLGKTSGKIKVSYEDNTETGFLDFTATPVLSGNTVSNGTYTVKITYGSTSCNLTVVVSGFLSDVQFTYDEVTLDYLCGHVLNMNQYLSQDLSNLSSDYTAVTWSLGNNATKDSYCSIDGTGIVTATRNTDENDPETIKVSVVQKSGIYVNGQKSVEGLSTKLVIDLYKLISRDHQGMWEPLGRIGLNFVIGGIDSYNIYTENRGMHPRVTISDSSHKDIPISYYAVDEKYGYRLYYGDGTIDVELPYLFLRTCHVGTYYITFEFYDKTGTELEGKIDSSFQVLPGGTPLTGDDFEYIPYICMMLLSLAVPVGIFRRKRKSKIK